MSSNLPHVLSLISLCTAERVRIDLQTDSWLFYWCESQNAEKPFDSSDDMCQVSQFNWPRRHHEHKHNKEAVIVLVGHYMHCNCKYAPLQTPAMLAVAKQQHELSPSADPWILHTTYDQQNANQTSSICLDSLSIELYGS